MRVKAAGINPGEATIRRGVFHAMWPSSFPSGQGSDLAGVVEAVGDAVTGWSRRGRGHRLDRRARQPGRARRDGGDAAHGQATRGSVGGRRRAVRGRDDRLGLCARGRPAARRDRRDHRRRGWRRIAHHPARAAHRRAGHRPGRRRQPRLAAQSRRDPGGLRRRRRRAHPRAGTRRRRRVRRHVRGYLDLALGELGVAPDRVNTIIPPEARDGIHVEGNAQGSSAEVLAELAGLVAAGELEVPIAATYPLDRVRDAYAELERRHTRGKIVLVP